MKRNLTLLLLITIKVNVFSAVIYVNQNGSGNQTGSDWQNAIAGMNLQQTIDNAAQNDTIWIACGTYYPTASTDRTISFSMRNDINIIGGFLGTETNLGQRNLTCGSCSILSGDIGQSNNESDNSYKVISNINLNQSAVLDGFQIINGVDDRSATGNEGLGGGIYNNGQGNGNECSPTFKNCIIKNNKATFGAGMFNNGFNGGLSNPLLINCYIEQNDAFDGGGGIDNFGLDGMASPTLINCVLANNSANTAGGMYCWGGGASGNSSPILINCTFYGNQATNGNAGGIIADNSDWGGATNSGTSNIQIQNSIFWNNTASLLGPQFFIKGTASFTAIYSCIDITNQTGIHSISGTNEGNIFSNPLFLNETLTESCLYDGNDRYMLQANSTCINTGNSSFNSESIDISMNPRLSSTSIDMGAYEYQTPTNLPTITALSSTSLCSDQTLDVSGTNFTNILAVSIGGTFVTYSILSSNSIVLYFTAGIAGNIQIITSNGTVTSQQNVIVYDLPIISITANGNTTFCQGQSVNLSSNSTTGNVWNDGSTNQQLSVTSSGDYFVTITDGNGCSATSNSVNIVVNPLPNVSVTSDLTSISATNGTATYQWKDCNSELEILNETNQIFIPANSGDFAVIITENGCVDTSLCVNFNFSNVSIEEVTNQSLKMFPNPTHDLLHFDRIINNVCVKNLLGQIVFRSVKPQNELQTKDLPDGIYLLETDNLMIRFEVKH